MAESIISSNNTHYTQQNPEPQYSWYSPKTGIYTSKHPKIQLPNDPFLDLVSHIFSYPNNGDNALIDCSSGYSIPYSHLFPLVKSTAFALKQMGISQGDLVLILLPNSIYFPILFLGVVYLGAIVTPMNPLSTFSEGYGMTESTAVGTRGLNVGDIHNYTSVGLLAPNMEAKMINWNTGSCLPPGQAGELLLRGPGIMKGYLNNREATRLTIEDGWLHTGDLAYFDHDGYLYILDRLKEIIKYKGYQIAPADLEAILISHPEILDVAVAAAPDEVAGEIPVAFVVRRPGSLLSRDEVVKHVAKEVAPHKKVREVVFVTSIPRSPAGKVLRRHLKNLQASKL